MQFSFKIRRKLTEKCRLLRCYAVWPLLKTDVSEECSLRQLLLTAYIVLAYRVSSL
jgi:hypothetical protein